LQACQADGLLQLYLLSTIPNSLSTKVTVSPCSYEATATGMSLVGVQSPDVEFVELKRDM
jgi:hypothetical protein